MPDAPELPQRKYTLQVYKKYGEANIAKFFQLITEEGTSVPKSIQNYEYTEKHSLWVEKKHKNQSDGTVYPLSIG